MKITMSVDLLKFARSADNTIIASEVLCARSFSQRLWGLIPRKTLKITEGMWFPRCNSAHSFFMSFAIDLILLDKEMKVVATQSLKPWRLSKIYFGADSMLEVVAGTVDRLSISKGDCLEMSHV